MAITLASINARLIRSWMVGLPPEYLGLPLWASGTTLKVHDDADCGKEGDSMAAAVTLALICLLGRRSLSLSATGTGTGGIAVSGGMDLRGVLGSVAGIEGKVRGAFEKVSEEGEARWRSCLPLCADTSCVCMATGTGAAHPSDQGVRQDPEVSNTSLLFLQEGPLSCRSVGRSIEVVRDVP